VLGKPHASADFLLDRLKISHSDYSKVIDLEHVSLLLGLMPLGGVS